MPRDEDDHLRGMWSGTISFGLVSIPVSLYPAIRGQPVRLRLLAEDGTPLRREYVCPESGEPLDRGELVRGYELEDGRLVVVEDEELEALAPERTRDIELQEFVELKDIPSFFFDRPYYLAPGRGPSRAYNLLARIMEARDRAGLATFVMHGREYLVAIMAQDGLLMAETLRFEEELRHPEDISLPERQGADQELVEQLSRSIKSLSSQDLDEEELKDRSLERLQGLIRRKEEAGQVIVREEVEMEEEPTGMVDLVSVFKERMRRAEQEGEGEAGHHAPTKAELYRRAREAGIPGRSKMSKEELLQALSS